VARRIPGLSHQVLTAAGYLIVGKEPSGEPIQRTEEPFEARAGERVLVLITGNDALFEISQRPAYVRVLLFRYVTRPGGIHRDLLPFTSMVWICARMRPMNERSPTARPLDDLFFG
jgi:hypothetical protein